MGCISDDNIWSQMEKRLNLQSISKFIKYGSVINETDSHSFIEREEIAYNNLMKYIEDTCGKEISENIMENITAYSSVKEDIYFTLGMKAGARIVAQLTDNNLESDS